MHTLLGASVQLVSDSAWKKIHRAVYHHPVAVKIRALVRQILGPTDPKR